MTSFIEVQHAEMVFTTKKGRFHALREIDLKVEKGEFVTLIGHSGCGKSTLLNLIAGLTRPSSGVLICDNREIAAPGPERAVVFQNHLAAALAHVLRERVPRGRARLLGDREVRAAEDAHARGARARQHGACIGEASARDLGRHEAAGRHRTRAGDGAEGAAARRAVRRPRRADPRPPAGRAAEDRRPHRQHRGDGDARRRRGGAALRPHRDDDQRPRRDHRRDPARRSGAAAQPCPSWSKTRTTRTTRKAVLDFLYTRHGHVERAAA